MWFASVQHALTAVRKPHICNQCLHQGLFQLREANCSGVTAPEPFTGASDISLIWMGCLEGGLF